MHRALPVAAALLFASNALWAQGASEATVAAHVAKARELAGDDLKPLLVLCQPAPARRASQAEIDQRLAKEIARPVPEPGQAFENLYYVGAAFVSAWAIKTSQGVILIDALNNPKEAADVIDGGMRKFGLDPADIKYLIVTHAHGDHYGGATYLQQKYGTRVVMSDADWKQTETKLEANSSLWGPVPKRDITVNDGDRVTLGDTTVTIHVTPGHTLGTITPTFDVKEGPRTHHVLLWGGTAFNFGNNIARLESYAAATERMAKLAEEQGIDVMISNHASYDSAFAKLGALRGAASLPRNPFVIGTPAVVRGLQTMGECARAQKDRFLIASAGGPRSAAHEVRRVVTRLDDSGKAVVLFDGNVPLSGERPPNYVANMWVTDKSLPDFSAEDRGKVKTGITPPKSGTVLRIVDFAPEPEAVAKMDKNTMMRIVGKDAPARGLPPRHPMMHRTRTLDYALIMSGEIDMLLDEGEVHLKAGDVVVQQATNHAWVNRGKAPCRVAFILMDSQEP